jgi:hypothetical protein
MSFAVNRIEYGEPQKNRFTLLASGPQGVGRRKCVVIALSGWFVSQLIGKNGFGFHVVKQELTCAH